MLLQNESFRNQAKLLAAMELLSIQLVTKQNCPGPGFAKNEFEKINIKRGLSYESNPFFWQEVYRNKESG